MNYRRVMLSQRRPAMVVQDLPQKIGAMISSNMAPAGHPEPSDGLRDSVVMTDSGGNYVDMETGESSWVSGVKKNGQDRPWAGSGKVLIEAEAVSDSLIQSRPRP
jgi:hypothetical protein